MLMCSWCTSQSKPRKWWSSSLYVQSPHDINHHPSISSSLNWCRVVQNQPQSLRWWMESSSTSQQLLLCWFFAVTTWLSSPFPSVELETNKVSKIYRRATWKLLVFPTINLDTSVFLPKSERWKRYGKRLPKPPLFIHLLNCSGHFIINGLDIISCV